MAIGRRELGAILLGAAAIMFYLVLLSTTPSMAQNGGGTNGTTSQNDSDEDCPGAEVVDEVTGTGDQQTAPFDIEGDSFLVTSDVTATSDPDFLFFSITVNDENGDAVTTIDQEQPGIESSFVNEGPGSFFVDVIAANVEYTITVEDCTGGGTITTPVTNLQPPAPRTTNQGGRTVVNVPNKPLPPSGGLPVYGVVAGCVLAGAGLLALGLGIRRGPQG